MSAATPDPTSSAPLVATGDAAPPRAIRRQVTELLAAGRPVALPTETVYGIAARADSPAALGALRQLKGRERDAPLTWHVASRDALDAFETFPAIVRRLAERYWPGPLTLVLSGVPEGLEEVARDGWTGVRLPAHRATRGLLEALEFPVVLSSANRSGEEPLTRAADVARAFPTLGLVVDGGDCRLGEASGVLRVGPGAFELLRAGILTLGDLRATAGLRIAFVCTGNTCRSPMATGLARRLLAERLGAGQPADPADFGFEVSSAGVAAVPGSPASGHALDVLAARGIDLSSHRSSFPTAERLRELDHVYCLTASHLARLRELVPGKAARRFELLDPDGHDVPDPIGGSLADYERCADVIDAAIQRRAVGWV